MAIELSRNLTFGQYLDLGSPVHRLDPRAKLLGVGALMTAVLITRSFGGVAVMVLAAFAFVGVMTGLRTTGAVTSKAAVDPSVVALVLSDRSVNSMRTCFWPSPSDACTVY